MVSNIGKDVAGNGAVGLRHIAYHGDSLLNVLYQGTEIVVSPEPAVVRGVKIRMHVAGCTAG